MTPRAPNPPINAQKMRVRRARPPGSPEPPRRKEPSRQSPPSSSRRRLACAEGIAGRRSSSPPSCLPPGPSFFPPPPPSPSFRFRRRFSWTPRALFPRRDGERRATARTRRASARHQDPRWPHRAEFPLSPHLRLRK